MRTIRGFVLVDKEDVVDYRTLELSSQGCKHHLVGNPWRDGRFHQWSWYKRLGYTCRQAALLIHEPGDGTIPQLTPTDED